MLFLKTWLHHCTPGLRCVEYGDHDFISECSTEKGMRWHVDFLNARLCVRWHRCHQPGSWGSSPDRTTWRPIWSFTSLSLAVFVFMIVSRLCLSHIISGDPDVISGLEWKYFIPCKPKKTDIQKLSYATTWIRSMYTISERPGLDQHRNRPWRRQITDVCAVPVLWIWIQDGPLWHEWL